MEQFTIKDHDAVIGNAQVAKDGLYYCISCLCHDKNELYQIEVVGDRGAVNLGTCIPMNGGLGIRTKVAVKRLGKIGGFVRKGKAEQSSWMALEEGKPVTDLSQLIHSRFRRVNGQASLLFDV